MTVVAEFLYNDLHREAVALRARVAELEKEVEGFKRGSEATAITGIKMRETVVAAESRVTDLETALATLLDAAERQAAGFPLESERWFAVRDYARARLPEKRADEVERG